jgi:hypothetical protein
MLAKQLIKISEGRKLEKAKPALQKALTLISEGKRVEAAPYAMKAFQILYFPPPQDANDADSI